MNTQTERGRYALLVLCLTASLFGLALIFSATRYDEALHTLPLKQGAALLAGLVLCFRLSRLDLRGRVEKLWWLLLLGNVGLLLLLVPFGNDTIETGDHVVVISRRQGISTLGEVLKRG